MRNKFFFTLLFVAAQLNAQTTGQNYVKSQTMLDSLGLRRQTSVQYYDGLGRSTQSVTNALGGNGTCMTAMKELDALDRETRSWLPQASPTNTTDFVSPTDFIDSASASGTYPYTENTYDVLERLVQSCGPGAEWRTAGKTVGKSYSTNSQNEVKMYLAPLEKNSLADKGYYAACTLEVEETTDEDGKSLKVYKDFLGHVVLERRNGNNDTYFVYNDLGQLRYVLSPEYQYAHHKEQDEYNQSTGSSDYKKKYAYEYRYDERGRVVKKILPGCDYIQYWYDNADRLTYMQDGNLRTKNLFRFMFYDELGRLALQGICSVCDRSKIGLPKARLNTKYRGVVNSMYEINGLDSDFRLKNIEIVNYYDNYDYLSAGIMKSNALLQSRAEKNNSACAIGLQTGRIVRASNGEMLFNVMYYDAKGRTEKTLSTQLGGYLQEATMSYTFTDNPKNVCITEINTNDSIVMQLDYSYEYNRFNDKLQSIELKPMLSERTFRIVENVYDDLGKLVSEKRGDYVSDIQYTYNVRNMLTSISSKEFSENIHYTDGIGTPCYNGNISSIQWQNGASAAKSGYKFSYDGLNRLTSAIYGEGDDMSLNVDRFSEKGITYNANGSIYRMKRYGMLNDGSYGLVDDIKAKLAGNQLYHIDDFAAETNYNGAFDFNDSEDLEQEYFYNGNGALESDANKGIAKIYYDDLNNPLRIVFTNGNTTEYVYSSTGKKLRTIHKTAVSGISIGLKSDILLKESEVLHKDSTDYHGNITYENGAMDKIYYQGGYLRQFYGSFRGRDRSHVEVYGPLYDFYYYTKDHLGNNRIVTIENHDPNQTMVQDTITIEKNNYYPFGGIFCTKGNFEDYKDVFSQPYKYNGKELDRTHGLDWYDYGARNYDAIVPMFTSIDPMCEKYYNISPYAYCANNPIKFIDPDGRKVIFAEGSRPEFVGLFNMVVDILRNRGLGDLYDKLDASEKVFIISENSYGENSFKAHFSGKFEFNKYITYVDGGTIMWDPTSAFISTNGHIINPIQILDHEMGHAADCLDNPDEYLTNSGTKDVQYGKVVERKNIEGREQYAARALGYILGPSEVTREDHDSYLDLRTVQYGDFSSYNLDYSSYSKWDFPTFVKQRILYYNYIPSSVKINY